ncbi:MAG: ANTAR domain-containing protein [Clostridia bacterium]|nr:ANTAR domain-containing protein [Clostridia bacterium]
MDIEKNIYSVLVVSSSNKLNESLETVLPDDEYDPVIITDNAGKAKRLLLEREFDIVMINAPLPDEYGLGLARDLSQTSASGILLLVGSGEYPDIYADLSPQGVLVISKPTSREFLTQSMRLLCGTRQRLMAMEKKTATIEEKMEEIRLVNRAKWLLIENLKMTEKEAHRYIEKRAMDRCVTKRSIAESIISMYK